MPGGPDRFTRDSTSPALLGNASRKPARFRLRGSHPLWQAFPDPSPNTPVSHSPPSRRQRQDTPHNTPHATPDGSPTQRVWAPPLSLATTHGIDLSFFSSGYFDVSVPRVALPWLCVPHGMTCQWHVGFPHSDVPGSRLTSSSPGLIAGCRVLLRYPAPRHPPRALQTSVPYGTDPNCTGSRKLFLLWLIRICLTYYASQQTEDTLLCPLLFQKELWHSVFKEHAVISHRLFRGFAPRKPNGMAGMAARTDLVLVMIARPHRDAWTFPSP